MKIFLVEDVYPEDQSIFDRLNSSFCCFPGGCSSTLKFIDNDSTWKNILESFGEMEADQSVGLFDLNFDCVSDKVECTRFSDSGLCPKIFRGVEPGIEMLLAYAEKANLLQRESLAVLASNQVGDARFKALNQLFRRRFLPWVRLMKVDSALSAENDTSDTISQIHKGWDDYFGSLSSRLRPSFAASWFKERDPEPTFMIHSDGENVVPLREGPVLTAISSYLASVIEIDDEVGRTLLNDLSDPALLGFYKYAMQHLVGACAVHCGRGAIGKRMNLHCVAFLACAFSKSPTDLFHGISWNLKGSAELLPSRPSSEEAENILDALVGRSGANEKTEGLFPLLGIHCGKGDAEKKGTKTVTNLLLESNRLEVTFALNGIEIAEKLEPKNGKPPTELEISGNSARAIGRLRELILPAGLDVTVDGNEETLKLTIKQP